MQIQTLKGFRDFLPREARKRQYVINILREVFELFGFEPLETPVLEYDEILSGKYGQEGEKLMYRFQDHGKRKVAMRYDQTVPLARAITQYQNELPMPFKRYQISNVWRAENTQKGRFREFTQCDIDTVGTNSVLADVETIVIAIKSLEALGFKNYKILINDRSLLKTNNTSLGLWLPNGTTPKDVQEWDVTIITAIDKLKKIGKDKVIEEIINKTPYTKQQAEKWIDELSSNKPMGRIKEILEKLNGQSNIEFAPTLARGLNYYTGMIFEIEIPEYPSGSVGGGGRYDNLIGMFAGKQIPAVGFAFGFDRLIEAMNELNLFPNEISNSSKVLVTIFNKDLEQESLEISSLLRANNIATEIWLGEIKEKNPLEKQLKYASLKKIPYAIILGENEVAKNTVILKELNSRNQKEIKLEEAINILKN